MLLHVAAPGGATHAVDGCEPGTTVADVKARVSFFFVFFPAASARARARALGPRTPRRQLLALGASVAGCDLVFLGAPLADAATLADAGLADAAGGVRVTHAAGLVLQRRGSGPRAV
jgi:hypothetical protein